MVKAVLGHLPLLRVEMNQSFYSTWVYSTLEAEGSFFLNSLLAGLRGHGPRQIITLGGFLYVVLHMACEAKKNLPI